MIVSVNAGWNLVSSALTYQPVKMFNIYPTSISQAYGYDTDSQKYIISEVLEPGKGYWAKFASTHNIVVLGGNSTSKTIEVDQGWNLVSNLNYDALPNQVTSTPPGIIISPFFEYSGKYNEADTLEKAKAYWTKVSQSGTITLNKIDQSLESKINYYSNYDGELPPPLPSEVYSENNNAPKEFSLEQNYPNPFNPTTDIRFQMTDFGFVSMKIYDVLGREISFLVNEEKQPGYYSVTWNATDRPSGMYYARMTLTDASGRQSYQNTIKLVLLK